MRDCACDVFSHEPGCPVEDRLVELTAHVGQSAEKAQPPLPIRDGSATFWQRVAWRLFGREPRHDCRIYLPRGDTLPAGARRVCEGCGATNVRYDYDDDFWEGTATFCGWHRVTPPGGESRG